MPPRFRHRRSTKFSQNPTFAFKVLAAVLVITLYFIIHLFKSSGSSIRTVAPPPGEKIQWDGFKDGAGAGAADKQKAARVVDAMKHTFWSYRKHAWGYDDILPVSGGHENSRNGWGAFLVDAASTLAIMGLWDELELTVEHIKTIDFQVTSELVDPFETTIRYLGGLVSLVDLVDSGVVPSAIVSPEDRDVILTKAVLLAEKLAPGFDTPTGMPWPRVNFKTSKGEPDPPEVYEERPELKLYDNPVIGPARTGSSVLENRVLSRLTGDPEYLSNATRSWSPLVWSKYRAPAPGLVYAPVDIVTGAPVGRQYHWDAGHDSYYEYLLKAVILAPHDRYSSVYKDRWLKAAESLHMFLASRSSPAPGHETQHLFIGKQNGPYFLNTQSHLACFAAGNLLLGGVHFHRQSIISFGQALLEGCHHTYNSTPTKIGPEIWSWMPKFGREIVKEEAAYEARSKRQEAERDQWGFWIDDARYRLRPEYVESLFYAWRITGQQRYREWAWDAFTAIERYCKTQYGFAGLEDVTYLPPGSTDYEEEDGLLIDDTKKRHLDESQSFWSAETLKYFWLLFTDVETASLDRWVFSTEGHLFRMIRE